MFLIRSRRGGRVFGRVCRRVVGAFQACLTHVRQGALTSVGSARRLYMGYCVMYGINIIAAGFCDIAVMYMFCWKGAKHREKKQGDRGWQKGAGDRSDRPSEHKHITNTDSKYYDRCTLPTAAVGVVDTLTQGFVSYDTVVVIAGGIKHTNYSECPRWHFYKRDSNLRQPQKGKGLTSRLACPNLRVPSDERRNLPKKKTSYDFLTILLTSAHS